MSWQIAADIREMFVDIVATDGSQTIFGRNVNRKDQLISGFAEALSLLPPDFKVSEASLLFKTDYDKIALREHWGSHTAFLTTEGFENLLEIGDQTRANLFGLSAEKVPQLISRDFSFGVTERTRADGSVEVGLDEKEIDFVLSKLEIAEVKSVAVCFLHSNKNPEHENQLANKLKEKGYEVVCSHPYPGDERARAQKACSMAFVLPGEKAFLEELQKIGFTKTSLIQNEAKSEGAQKGNSSMTIEFLEDRICVRHSSERSTSYFETRISPLNEVSIDEGGLVHVGPGRIESEPGPVAFGKGINLSVLDLIAFSGKLKIGGVFPRLKVDLNRVSKQLVPLAKQLQLDPETCAKKYLVLFYEKLASEIIGRVGSLNTTHLEGLGWLALIMANPLAKNLGVRKLTVPSQSGWGTLLAALKAKSTGNTSQSWGSLEFENGSLSEGKTLDF